MQGAGGIEMSGVRLGRGNDAALRHLDDVVAERLRHGIERQRAVGEPLHEVEAADCALLLVSDDAEAFASCEFGHDRFVRIARQ